MPTARRQDRDTEGVWADAQPSANEFHVGWCSTFCEMNSSNSMDSEVVSSMPVNFSNVAMSVSCAHSFERSLKSLHCKRAPQMWGEGAATLLQHTPYLTHTPQTCLTLSASPRSSCRQCWCPSKVSPARQVKRSQQEVRIERESAAKELLSAQSGHVGGACVHHLLRCRHFRHNPHWDRLACLVR